jgi:hypothetical protein
MVIIPLSGLQPTYCHPVLAEVSQTKHRLPAALKVFVQGFSDQPCHWLLGALFLLPQAAQVVW